MEADRGDGGWRMEDGGREVKREKCVWERERERERGGKRNKMAVKIFISQIHSSG